nr:hypothetical protein [Tanacetum cinerariifolium]
MFASSSSADVLIALSITKKERGSLYSSDVLVTAPADAEDADAALPGFNLMVTISTLDPSLLDSLPTYNLQALDVRISSSLGFSFSLEATSLFLPGTCNTYSPCLKNFFTICPSASFLWMYETWYVLNSDAHRASRLVVPENFVSPPWDRLSPC